MPERKLNPRWDRLRIIPCPLLLSHNGLSSDIEPCPLCARGDMNARGSQLRRPYWLQVKVAIFRSSCQSSTSCPSTNCLARSLAASSCSQTSSTRLWIWPSGRDRHGMAAAAALAHDSRHIAGDCWANWAYGEPQATGEGSRPIRLPSQVRSRVPSSHRCRIFLIPCHERLGVSVRLDGTRGGV
jgi:hypothetical protein